MATNLHITPAPLSDPSSMQSTLQICSPVRSNPRYLQQRIEGLEQELDNKRVQLFQSEEARLELEARLTGNSETPTTAVTDSMKQVECGGVGGIHEWLGLNGDSEGHENASLLEKYERYIELLYKGRSNDIDELVGYHQAEIKYLEANHVKAMEQLRRSHETEHQPQALESKAAYLAHQQELAAVKSAHKALQQELRALKAAHQQELATMKSTLKANHQELAAMMSTHQANQQELAAMKSTHQVNQQELAALKSEQRKTAKGASKTNGVPHPLIYAAKAKSTRSINQFCAHSREVLVDIVESNFKSRAVREQASQATKMINQYMDHSRQFLSKILDDNFNKHTLSMNVDEALAGVVVRAPKKVPIA